MPVVPFTPQALREPKAIEIAAADEPWVLMAAAMMDSEGRLVEPEAPKPTEAQMARARATLKNGMEMAQDPTEGDFFAPEKYNTVLGASGIRKYEGDR